MVRASPSSTDARLPGEKLSGQCDVRSPAPGIVDRQGLKDDLARAPAELAHHPGQSSMVISLGLPMLTGSG